MLHSCCLHPLTPCLSLLQPPPSPLLLCPAPDPSCSEVSARRRSQVGTGSRSEKIKTYNYKDTRMSGAALWGGQYSGAVQGAVAVV